MCLNYTCIFFFFQLAPARFPRAFFVVFASAAVAHGIIVILIKINILFYGHHVQAHISKYWCNFNQK